MQIQKALNKVSSYNISQPTNRISNFICLEEIELGLESDLFPLLVTLRTEDTDDIESTFNKDVARKKYFFFPYMRLCPYVIVIVFLC